MKTAEFGQPCAVVPERGRCRICGCGGLTHCLIATPESGQVVALGYIGPFRTCVWTDDRQTLCDAPNCITAAKHEIGVDS